MSRWVVLLNIGQALLFGVAVWLLWPRFEPAAVVAGLCCGLQLLAAVGLFLGRTRIVQGAALGTVAGVAIVVGMYLQGVFHIQEAFGPQARKMAAASVGGVFAALPWALGFPLWQALSVIRIRWVAGMAALMLGPILAGAWQRQPLETWPAVGDLELAATTAFARWNGGAAPLADQHLDRTVLLTPWSKGVPGTTVRGHGLGMSAAIDDALSQLPTFSPGAALVLDVALAEFPKGVLLGPEAGRLTASGGQSPPTLWRPEHLRRIEVLPAFWLPQPKSRKGNPALFSSAVVDSNGANRLEGAWTPSPELSPKALLEAATEGGRMIVRNMRKDGRFAYRVKGPSGELGGGYNYPRHAGTTWFLARLAQRTGDDEIAAGAEAALRFMEGETVATDVGRAVKDPNRTDGKIWVGTTALATLAALSHGDAMAPVWGGFVASSVASEGEVRGEYTTADQQWHPQPLNPYGTGQATLALASLVRAGHTEFRDSMDRSFNFFEGGFAPGAAERLFTLDQHWTCIAAQVGDEVLGRRDAAGICRAYLENERARVPSPGSKLLPRSGPLGGLAEAYVSGAVLFPGSDYAKLSADFGWMFLRNAYRSTDTPFLARPQRLIGGFRDAYDDLDVQMDSVQHIGCALLGIEALISGQDHPGSMP